MCLGLQFITGVKLFALERQVADLAAPNGYLGMIRVILFRTNFADDESLANFFAFMDWNIVIGDEKKIVSSSNLFSRSQKNSSLSLDVPMTVPSISILLL